MVMRRHPIFSVKELVRLKGVNDMAIRVTIGAFEHHLNYDLSGYPKLANKRTLSLLGRIICIVDCYDALTSSRVYNRVPFPPDKALRFMLNKSGKAFDPILMKLFVNAIGVYPIGTVVLLNTKEIGVVFASNPNPEKGDRPKVKRILDADGKESMGEVLDLSEQDEAGQFRYEIANVIDATKYKIDVAKYFL
jgi:HD-GYP domain-containing protein (c-di-GMP phosphodiesterase class II)